MEVEESERKTLDGKKLKRSEGENFRLEEERRRSFYSAIDEVKRRESKGRKLSTGTSIAPEKKPLWKEYDMADSSLLSKSSSKIKDHLKRFVHERHSEVELREYEDEMGENELGSGRGAKARYIPRGRIK